MTSHNLLQQQKPPDNWKSLLGLGMNFCIRRRYTNGNKDIDKSAERFRYDIKKRIAYGIPDDIFFDKTFHIPSKKPVPDKFIPIGLNSRLDKFFMELKKKFRRKKVSSNLLPHQYRTLRVLRNHPSVATCGAEKYLGPCIAEKKNTISSLPTTFK